MKEEFSRDELKKSMMVHREDNEAFQAYMHRLDTDPDVKWIQGSTPEETMELLKQRLQVKDREKLED